MSPRNGLPYKVWPLGPKIFTMVTINIRRFVNMLILSLIERCLLVYASVLIILKLYSRCLSCVVVVNRESPKEIVFPTFPRNCNYNPELKLIS